MKPHKVQGWLNPGCRAEVLEKESAEICRIYQSAATDWETQQLKTVSTDEKTGIQALQRSAPDLPLQPGRVCKHAYEYIRPGTQCLTANWDVAEGKIISPTMGDTRTETDFVRHIRTTVASDATVKKWRFVVDNLNTHQSESLVLYVAELSNIARESLGEKGKWGILKDRQTRSHFLQNQEHTVFFVYTPKHCSWLNQIEIWFSILSRKLLKRANFSSIEELKNKLLEFITYFNIVLAKPFKWNYNGKPCKV